MMEEREIKIPPTKTGTYQIEYLLNGETYEYCDEENIQDRLKELKSDQRVTIIEVHEVPPMSVNVYNP